MILAAAVLGLAYGLLLRRGFLSSILKKHFRVPVLIFLSLGMEFLLKSEYLRNSLGGEAYYPVLRIVLAILQYALVLTFLFRNRFKPGMGCLMAGSVLNGLVICSNGGRMPIGHLITILPGYGAAALEKIAHAPHYFLAAGGEPFLWFGDLIPFWTFGFYMISVGDILLSIGAFRLAAYMPRRVTRQNQPTLRRACR